jgi:hypothetical protein
MTSTLYVDNLIEKTSGNGVQIPGHVIQTVYVESTTSAVYSMGSTTTSTDLYSAAITPNNTSSKILISINLQWGMSNTNGDFGLYLKRGSTRIGGRGNDSARGGSNIWFANDDRVGSENQQNYNLFNASWQYLDSPNTTSSTTYTVGAAIHTIFTFNRHYSYDNGGTSSITLQEIAQ